MGGTDLSSGPERRGLSPRTLIGVLGDKPSAHPTPSETSPQALGSSRPGLASTWSCPAPADTYSLPWE